jgi:hypothetical protein
VKGTNCGCLPGDVGGRDQTITGLGDLRLKNYQRHDYQKSWRVAGGGWRVNGKLEGRGETQAD